MRSWVIRPGEKDNLMKDLIETILSFEKLGEKYGVSRQAVWDFFKRRGIRRPLKPKGHQTEECRLCQKLIQISKRPHSEFISNRTLLKKIGVPKTKCLYHLHKLRDKGLVSQTFGRLRSKRAENAYGIYFTKRLSISAIERKVGYKSFRSIIRRHRALGWNVPPSLYVYDGRERRKVQIERHRRKKW